MGWSYILDLENNANPFLEKRVEIQRWKEVADSFVDETEVILLKMNKYTAIGLKPLDALHIACAVSLQCQYFLTTFNGLLPSLFQSSYN